MTRTPFGAVVRYRQMARRVLFQPVYMETPHFETELELMADHLETGDDVFVLTCAGELPTCFANYAHESSLCRVCQARRSKGLSLLGHPVTLVPYPFSEESADGQIPDSFADLQALKSFTIGRAEAGLAAASSLCSRFATHEVDTIRHSREVATELATAYYVYRSVKQVLLDVKPDCMYLFNGRLSTTLPALNACEELGVPYFTHERGGMQDRYLVLANTMPHDIGEAHRLLELRWSSHGEAETRRVGAQFFVDRRNRIEHSWHSYTSAQRVDEVPVGFDPSRKNVAIFNTSLEEVAAVRHWPSAFHVYRDEIEAVDRICDAFAAEPHFHFYLRVHPSLTGRDNAQMRALRSLDGRHPNLTIVSPDSVVDTYALVERSSVVVTFGSTVGVEACYWGTPSILLGRAYYEQLDCTYRPHSHEEVIGLLRSELAPKPLDEALKYGFWELRQGRPFKRYRPESLTRGTFLGERVVSVSI